jgi:hypothetical protein
MFEEAESRRVFDAAAKKAVRGKSDAGGPKLQGGVSFGSFLFDEKRKEHF